MTKQLQRNYKTDYHPGPKAPQYMIIININDNGRQLKLQMIKIKPVVICNADHQQVLMGGDWDKMLEKS